MPSQVEWSKVARIARATFRGECSSGRPGHDASGVDAESLRGKIRQVMFKLGEHGRRTIPKALLGKLIILLFSTVQERHFVLFRICALEANLRRELCHPLKHPVWKVQLRPDSFSSVVMFET